MARLKYPAPEAERIFQKNNVDNRLASPTASIPDAAIQQMQQEMMDRLTNPDNAVAPSTLKQTA